MGATFTIAPLSVIPIMTVPPFAITHSFIGATDLNLTTWLKDVKIG